MKHLVSILFLFFSTVVLAGFAPETLVSVPTHYVAIKDVAAHDKVLCYDFAQQKSTVQSVDRVTHKIVAKAVCIAVQDACIVTALDQRFYVPAHRVWIRADALSINDQLLTIDGRLLPVDSITTIDGPIELYELTVHELHNFCVSRHSIVVHNTGLELVPVALCQLVPIAGFASVTPLAPVLYAGCAVAAATWACWYGVKHIQNKIKRNEARLLEQQNNNSNDTPSNDTEPIEFYQSPTPDPEDPKKDKKKETKNYKPSELENPAHDVNQYAQLNNELRISQFSSIIKVTKHGIQRLIERNFIPEEIYELKHAATYIRNQYDGAMVFIKELAAEKFNVMIINENAEELVTALRHVNRKNVINLGKRYGWKL